jgi:hypothetical protein
MVLYVVKLRSKVLLQAQIKEGGVENGGEERVKAGRGVAEPQTSGRICKK